MPEMESEQPYWAERDTEVQCRVLATIIDRDVNLSHTYLRSVPGLENLSVFHGFQQGTNFPVTPEEGAVLLRLVGAREKGTFRDTVARKSGFPHAARARWRVWVASVRPSP